MFSMLFGDESATESGAAPASSSSISKDSPPPKRPTHGFCGILNQGATCYLNSLLQTLFLTPEFRVALFRLGPNELGRIEDKDKKEARVRIIPIELQRLFAQMLHLDQAHVSTTDLTDSFGWTNNEELQQHDVQELNRILFIAIEESLVGTSGQNLIKDLYHGVVVNQIVCQECGRISENQEHFLDLTVTVAGNIGLENGLYHSFVETEKMEGKNQYRCEVCNKLVNAKKGAKIRHLPPILSFSLLRFSFDFIKMERYKENGKFTFPMSIDMARYLEDQASPVDTEYDLFSVVIHSGSAYGGHYHAYIRDVEGNGTWVPPEEEVITLPNKKDDQIDLIQLDSPRNVLKALLENTTEKSMVMDTLAQELMKQTGVSWNKRFKKHHGTINKFVQKHNDIFIFNEAMRTVSLKSDIGAYSTLEQDGTTNGAGEGQDAWIMNRYKSKVKEPPPLGHCWFDFNDTHAHPIWPSDLEKQFSGRESGYMLFYRRRSCDPKVFENDALPSELLNDVIRLNEELNKKREEYESEVNLIELSILESSHYEYSPSACAVKLRRDAPEPRQISLDRRKTTLDLHEYIKETISCSFSKIHVIKKVPAGFHLYDEIVCDNTMLIKDTGVCSKDSLFLWDGDKLHGEVISTGAECEPILLTIHEGDVVSWDRGFPKNLPLGALRMSLQDILGKEHFDIQLMKMKGNLVEYQPLTSDKDDLTLKELELGNGSELLISDCLSESLQKLQNMTMSIENRCMTNGGLDYPVIEVKAKPDITVEELKALVVSQLPGSLDILGGGRFRIDDKNAGLLTPLCEDQTLESAGITETTSLVIEPGCPPANDEMTVTFQVKDDDDIPDFEMILGKSKTVGETLSVAASHAGLKYAWHLRQLNWCGEPAAILDDPDRTLEQCNIRDGAHLMLEEGRLPPKGCFQLPVWLYPTPANNQDTGGYIAWITSSVRGLMGGSTTDNPSNEPKHCGVVEIAKDSSINDLKSQIRTLQSLEGYEIPTDDFLRVRVLENGKMKNVLRDNRQCLQRQRVSSGSQLCIQVLSQEETLGNNDILLEIWERVPQTRTYSSRGEIVWDSGKCSLASSLKQRIANHLTLPVEHIVIAKHFSEKHEWMKIKETTGKQTKGNRGKKKENNKVNVKQAPYLLKEGDVIGVKNLAYDPEDADDFSTAEDDAGKERLKQIEEEKRKERLERKEQWKNGKGPPPKNRPEVGLSIKVGDFR